MSTPNKLRTLAFGIVVALSVTVGCNAENPIIQTNFTADPPRWFIRGRFYSSTKPR